MRHKLLLLLLLLIPIPSPGQQQSAPQQVDFPSEDQDASKNGDTSKDENKSSPLSLSFGPQSDNAIGAILKGEGLLTSERAWLDQGNNDHVSVSGFLTYLVDAGWSTAEDAKSNAQASLRPTVALNFVRGSQDPNKAPTLDPKGYPYLFLDARQRYGEFENEESGGTQKINQTILGVGLGYRFKVLTENYTEVANATGKTYEQPRFEVNWYKIHDSSEDEADLPDDLVADQIRARLTGDIPLYNESLCPEKNNKTVCRWILFADVSGTKATTGSQREWKLLYDVGLKYDLLSGNIKPVIHYRSGEEAGFQYDRQLLIGAILDLAGFGGD